MSSAAADARDSESAPDRPAALAQNEMVLGNGQVAVEACRVPEQGHATPHGPAFCGQVVAQHDHFAGSRPEKAGAQAEEGGLAGAVGPLYEHGLASLDGQVDTGEGGEAPQERHGSP